MSGINIRDNSNQVKNLSNSKVIDIHQNNKDPILHQRSSRKKVTRGKQTLLFVNQEAVERLSKEEFLDFADHSGEIEKAEKHKKANMILDYDKLHLNYDTTEFCDDCMCPIPEDLEKTRFNFCIDTKKLANYGNGLYLYFFYMKFLIYNMIVLLGMVSIPHIYYAITQYNNMANHCLVVEVDYYDSTENETYIIYEIPPGRNYCEKFINDTNTKDLNFLWEMTYENFDLYNSIHKDREVKDYAVVNFTLVYFLSELVLIIVNIIFTILAYNLNLEIDMFNNTPEDFALLISDIPTDLKNEELKEFFKLDNIEIHDVIRTYKLDHFYSYKSEYIYYRKMLFNLYNNEKPEIKLCCKKPLKREDILMRMNYLDNKMTEYIQYINENEDVNIDHIGESHNNHHNSSKIMQSNQQSNNDLIIENMNRNDNKEELLKISINNTNKMPELNSNDTIKHVRNAKDININEENPQIISEIRDILPSNTKKELKKDSTKNNELLDKELGFSDSNEYNKNHLLNNTAFFIFNKSKDSDEYNNLFPESILGYFSLYTLYALLKSVFYCCSNNDYRKSLRKRLKHRCTRTEEPTDIIWENLEYSMFDRVKRTFLIFLVSLIILGGSFIALYFISKKQNDYSKSESNFVKYGTSLGFSIIIFIINKLLQVALKYLTSYEKQMSWSAYYLSYSYKLLISSFINTAIVPLLVYAINNWEAKGKIL